MRKTVYERALSAGESEERAALLATIFRNCYFMGCSYPEEVLKNSQTYWDPEWVEHFVCLSQL